MHHQAETVFPARVSFRAVSRNAGIALKALWREIVKSRQSYLFLFPFFSIFFAFTVLPVIISIVLSFTDYNILQVPYFIGWSNYINLFQSDVFFTTVKNTLLFASITGPLGYLISFFMAWLINELSRGMRVLLTFILYAPSLSGQLYIVWQIFFSGDSYGYANGFLQNLNLIDEPIQFLTDPLYMQYVAIIILLWMSMGTNFLVFIAGLQTLPQSYYEAALVDGIKNRWQELWYITLPQMKPQLMFGAVMAITNSFMLFDQITNLFGFPSTDYAVDTIVGNMVDHGMVRFEMGYASSIATILFLLMVGCNKGVQKLLQRVSD